MSDLNDVSYKLGQMDGKLDLLLEAMKAHIISDDAKHAETDAEISKLKQQRAWVIGASTAVAFIVSLVSNIGSFK